MFVLHVSSHILSRLIARCCVISSSSPGDGYHHWIFASKTICSLGCINFYPCDPNFKDSGAYLGLIDGILLCYMGLPRLGVPQ